MGAPKGNRFWEFRSKHGREKLFGSPTLMWDAACEYFNWCVDNPILDPRSFGGKQKIQRPFTMHGLCLYMNCNTGYFRTFKAQLPDGEKDYNTVIYNIEETVFQQKFENAAIGVYNHSIIARDLGLADKIQNEVTNIPLMNIDPLDSSTDDTADDSTT
ncbi:terminase small subunit [Pedobacter lusitanus]|uniref:terminase small subunit n=1 Tax=Pedobacter lusitanus TaxID=1503925 RepID=UPI000695D45D|nr:terminase small subunit [Pedobacter lusitanus]